ncbi:MAG: DUF2818 family protein [Alcaligenaceae bacterium]|nr:DUF2818 family protein [Alcaligenaceae bacterium]
MTLSVAVWTLIVLALVTANLPFILDRPLAAFPWALRGEAPRAPWLRWLRFLVFFGLLVAWIWVVHAIVGGAFAGGGGSGALFAVKVLAMCILAAALLTFPGWGSHPESVHKPFIICLLEAMIGYTLVGALGFALELNIGNVFTQGWEFYAVTLSLFLVLGYPGFVYRYMLKRRLRK